MLSMVEEALLTSYPRSAKMAMTSLLVLLVCLAIAWILTLITKEV
jgi:hypothetical protein